MLMTSNGHLESGALAERPLLGYPGATVALYIEDRDYTVVIDDPASQEVWKPATKAEAVAMYFHPFVYGYTYTGNGSSYQGEDGA